jgi:glycine/sarcosine/betaine reductase complex component A
MDLEDQGSLKRVIDEHAGEDLVVILGSPDEESARVYAETVTIGDPSWAGPLAGVSLGLPVYHILEDEVRQELDQSTYEQHVAMMEMVLDKETISDAVRSVREQHSKDV